jgi:23S rRNA (adenine2503-C2)-methyltransferase
MPNTNLKALSREEIESFMKGAGFPVFRARQLVHWIYERLVQSIDQITEFSKQMRDELSETAYISNLELIDQQTSKDGTEKFLFGLEDGETIESVLIADDDRLTLCISSQAGCALGCSFCLTGRMGLKRNLMPHEIVDQVIAVNRLILPARITNIVMMGMGEPLANAEAVIEALWRMTKLLQIPPRRITVSTAGIVPGIRLLGEKAPPVNLAISLNATTDAVRDTVMPVNKTYPIKKIIEACKEFPLQTRRSIMFEYVLLNGVNDTHDDAKRLLRLLRGIPSKINLIPFNPCNGSEYTRPDEKKVLEFQKILLDADMRAMIRKSKGQDILAACGQLKAKYE